MFQTIVEGIIAQPMEKSKVSVKFPWKPEKIPGRAQKKGRQKPAPKRRYSSVWAQPKIAAAFFKVSMISIF